MTFIATANDLSTIPLPLLDRLEIIELSAYSAKEKIHIASNFLLPRQLSRHGLPENAIKIDPVIMEKIIFGYTREAGVRQLERAIASLCRATAVIVASRQGSHLDWHIVTDHDLEETLGPTMYLNDFVHTAFDKPGIVNGLSYTSAGCGALLPIETTIYPGKVILLFPAERLN